MTKTEINSLAMQAAESVVDAHGPENPVSAMLAYSFMYEMVWNAEEETLPQMTGRDFRQFKHDYRRHLRNAGVPLDLTQRL